MIKKIHYLLLLSYLFVACKEAPPKPPEKIQPLVDKILPNDIKTITPEEAKTYHKNPERKYEYRTGTYNNYEYNYDVKGKSDSLRYTVKGNINVKGKYGAGILMDSLGHSLEVDVEWIGYDLLKGVDKQGRTYTLSTQ
jgi:hypothetical protein